MNSPLEPLLMLLLVIGHAPLLWRILGKFRAGLLPPTWQFGALGIIIFYDLGLLLQMAGMPYQSMVFPHLEHATETELTLLVLVVLASPYLLGAGSFLVRCESLLSAREHLVPFAPRTQLLFVLLLVPPSLALAAFGINAVWGAASIASIKLDWLAMLGSAYIVFLLPMFAVAFLVRTRYSRTPMGRLLVLLLVACSAAATLFLGQRTMTLLPILILFLFYFRFRFRYVLAGGIIIVSFAAGMMLFYKGYAVRQDLSFTERVQKVINDDLTRGNVLLRALQESEMVGTRVLPLSGQGYWYAATLFVPRRILPQKGYSTTAYFTGGAIGQDVEFLDWGLGVGFLEQICLNFGWLALMPGTFLYGFALGLLDLLRLWRPGTVAPVSLGAAWMSGYDLASVVLYFGSMLLFALLMETLCGRKVTRNPGHSARLSPSLPTHEIAWTR